ncbi:MAG TPA: ABC transporter ATP-binding protein [Thermoleophilia bacterium]|nr:ABC transporter ATP-binding protein [Thermoleophilia bacterium]
MKRLLLVYLRPYRLGIIVVVVLALVQALANLYLPDLNAKIINDGVAKGDTAYILRMGGFMLLVTLLLGLVSVVLVYYGSRVAMGFGRDVRSGLFRKVESFSQSEINQFGTPSLITRNTNDVQQVQMLVAIGLTMMIGAPLMMIGGVIMAMRQDLPLSTMLVVIIPVMGVVLGLIVARAVPLFRSIQVKLDRINQVTREILTGMRVIRAFARSDYEEDRFDEANADLTATGLRVTRLFALMFPALFAILNLSTVAIMYFGGGRVASGAMPIGNLTAFLTYVMQILISVLMATMMLAMVPRATASADRIQQVLDVEPSIADPDAPLQVVSIDKGRRGLIEFKDVEFRYPGAEHPVLCSISFSVTPGRTTAIVGSTGSGKSTLISLIPRFYDVTAGSIEIDGCDIRTMARDDLWHKMGFVPQKAFLFAGTIASNLRFGAQDATDEDLWHALSIAQAKEFVTEMPEGLGAPVTQGGGNVSGGQRQRLAIARALVKKPEIYVFDDSFSALDFKTDSMLRAALKREVSGAAVIIVAQRVSSIMQADQIVVLETGAIAGIGTHAELLESCETYREIVYSQLSAEEVA